MKPEKSSSYEKIRAESQIIEKILAEVSKVIIGQRHLLERMMIALITQGHILLEGVPGLAKTLAIKTLGKATNLAFKRIQFTPDLLPADLTGTLIFNPKNSEFYTRKGPIFTHLLLADEINRAPAKVQSALLESMQEFQVTIGDQSHPLERPFLVMATQNPIEQEGTYPLPEAQIDRFFMKVKITYPSLSEEREIVARWPSLDTAQIRPVCGTEDVLRLSWVYQSVYIDERLSDYIIRIVQATRLPAEAGMPQLKPLIQFGASPRASIYLVQAAKALAFIQRREYATPDDVKAVARDILRHRIILSYEAEAEGITTEETITEILNRLEVP